jgi:MoaA/NifB/PqqE/SkfB family radical SAM enzyme
MCNAWNHPSIQHEEIDLDVIQKLPSMYFVNITGGEPFIRKDLQEIVSALNKKSKRIVISTNGYYSERILDLCNRFPGVGIRISIEGLAKANDQIRGIPDGFDRAMRTLLMLREMGLQDIGFGMTVQDSNAKDLVYLYYIAKSLGYEFATATLHNSQYFHKLDNKIEHKEEVVAEFKKLIKLLLKSTKMKDWFRAYFNYGVINYIKGKRRLLPCDMGLDGFFIDPYGYVLPCNGMDTIYPMGNLKKDSWDQIWNSKNASDAREKVRGCEKNCWMIGSVAPAIWRHPMDPILWVIKNKIRVMLHKNMVSF